MRRSLVLALVALMASAALPSRAAERDPAEGAEPKIPARFRMFGAGFGHGLGMSQWGAYGLAKQGWTPTRILEHFYSDTRVGTAADPPASLRIGLVQGADSVRLLAQSGPVELRLGARDGQTVATIASGETWKVRVAGRRYRIVDGQGSTVDRVGGPNNQLFAIYDGSRVRIPEAFHTYNRGTIEFDLYACDPGDCRMRLVLTIDPQGYLYGLGEVPSSWPKAALRAQAIAARTYALTKASSGQHRPVCDCALYASAYDQVYAGWDKEGGTDGERWVAAVDATGDKVVLHGGETIQAFYMSSSGGHTEDNENVWGGTPIDYLRGVCDPGDYTSANPNAVWEETFSPEEVTRDLRLGIGTVIRFSNVVRGVSGRILTVRVRGTEGSASISGSTLRSELGLPDDRVWINANRLVTGPIREKYDALRCSPGLPTSRQVSVAGGKRQSFEDGTIYHSIATGAHALWGPVLDRYQQESGPAGDLGFPTTDVLELTNGNLRARFQHGVITCQPDGSRCRVS